jgi:hypothetical protein
MSNRDGTKTGVGYSAAFSSRDSAGAMYFELDSAIIAAIKHARSFCADDVVRTLQNVFDEMKGRRKAHLN